MSSSPNNINPDKALPIINNSNDLHQEIVSQYQVVTNDNAFGASVALKVNKQISQNEFEIHHITQTSISTTDPFLEFQIKLYSMNREKTTN